MRGKALKNYGTVAALVIIIGKNGQMLKKISTDARKDCERFMGTKVFLQTWVRVMENWRDSDFMISNFGYHKD